MLTTGSTGRGADVALQSRLVVADGNWQSGDWGLGTGDWVATIYGNLRVKLRNDGIPSVEGNGP